MYNIFKICIQLYSGQKEGRERKLHGKAAKHMLISATGNCTDSK